MADDTYTVRVNRSEGIVEISGSDKAWVTAQLESLRAVIEGDVVPSGERSDDGGADKKVKSTRTAKPRGKRRAASGASKTESTLGPKLTSAVQTSLQAFVDDRKDHFKQATEQAPILAVFLKDELSVDSVTADDLYTVFSVMGWKIPKTINALNNAKTRKGYFTASNGEFRLTHKGENFGRHDSKA